VESPLVKWGLDVSKAPPAVQASREPIIRFFSYHDAHPVALTMVLLEKFGAEWFVWEADALKEEILRTFNATSISEHNWQKIQAVRTLTETVGFWEEWHIFEKIIQALNNNVPRFDIAQRCSLSQLMAGVDIAETIRKRKYGEEIEKYVSACAIDEGVIYLPSPLDFAQQTLAEPMYRCRVCGRVDTDDIDGRCDFCTGRFLDDHPLNFKPADGVPQDAGTQLEKFYKRDYRSTEKRFNELKLKDRSELDLDDDKPEDVQSAKLLVALDYMKKRQVELIEQLEELKSWVTH